MSDEELLQAFESQAVTHEEWNHRAHVRMAYLYLKGLDLDEGLSKIRDGIKRLNAVHQVPESVDRGYHETITAAFARIVHAAIRAWNRDLGIETSEEFCDAHPHLLQKTLLRLHYTRGRIMTWEAKERFVEPDICQLPPKSGAL